MEWLRGALKSLTIWVANFMAAAGVTLLAMLDELQQKSELLKEVLTPRNFAISLIGIAVIQILLRAKTTQSLSDKGQKKPEPT